VPVDVPLVPVPIVKTVSDVELVSDAELLVSLVASPDWWALNAAVSLPHDSLAFEIVLWLVPP
jgi:hypothetical protein